MKTKYIFALNNPDGKDKVETVKFDYKTLGFTIWP